MLVACDTNVIVSLALASKAAALVSGDRHILAARDRLPCRVLTVAEFLVTIKEH